MTLFLNGRQKELDLFGFHRNCLTLRLFSLYKLSYLGRWIRSEYAILDRCPQNNSKGRNSKPDRVLSEAPFN